LFLFVAIDYQADKAQSKLNLNKNPFSDWFVIEIKFAVFDKYNLV